MLRSVVAFLAVVLTTACMDDVVRVTDLPSESRVSSDDPNNPRPWHEYSADDLFSYVAAADTTVIVGLTVPGKRRGVKDGRVVLDQTEWSRAGEKIGLVPGVRVVDRGSRLPAVLVHVRDAMTLTMLRQSPYTDYVEPAKVQLPPGASHHAELGCSSGGGGWGGPIEYIGGDILPWNSKRMKVPEAWERANGSGVTIGLVDTGIDPVHPELNSQFASGQSTGRTIRNDWTQNSAFAAYGYPAWSDDCGHGTHMAGTIAAPKNNTDIVGIAWGANLVSVRHHDDVWNGGNSWSTAEGIDVAAGVYGSQIIVMAFMSSNESYYVGDMIRHWYNQERLFIGAAGTSLCNDGWTFVVFPANMYEVMAVTGVDANGNMPCQVHHGWQVLATAYVNQPTLGARLLGESGLGESKYSSNAAAVIAGIAALAWSRYPTASRDVIKNKLRWAQPGFHPYPGPVNAFGAVGGLFDASPDGPALVETTRDTTITYTALWKAAPSVSFAWNNGATTESTTYFVRAPNPSYEQYTFFVQVTVTDPFDGRSLTVGKNVMVRHPFPDCPTCM